MTVDYHSAEICRLLLRVELAFLFLFYDGRWAFVSKNVIITTFWAFFTFFGLGFLIFNAEVIIPKVIVFIFLNLLDETHVDKVFNLLFLIFSPFIYNFALFIGRFKVRVLQIFLLLGLLSFELFLVLLAVVILKKLLLVSLQLVLSQLPEGCDSLYRFFNNTLIDSLALYTALDITVAVPVGIFLLLELNRRVISSLSVHRLFPH